jgi:hypothetical protein
MSVTSAKHTILERLGFSFDALAYLTKDCGIDSLEEIAYLDGDRIVETNIKGVTIMGGTVNFGIGTLAATPSKNGNLILIRDVSKLKLCVYYLKHMERVRSKPVVNDIDLELVRSYHDQQRYEDIFKKTAEIPVINYKDWPRTLENIKEYLASQYGGTRATLYCVVRPEIEVKPEAEDHLEDYDTVDKEMTARDPLSGGAFVNERRKVWDIMSNIFCKHYFFVYIKPVLFTKNGRDAYMLLFDHFLGPHNVGNMASAAETKLNGTLDNGEKKRFTWETYVQIHTEQHSVLNCLKDYEYVGIDDSSKVHHLLKGIKTTKLDVCKTQFMPRPTLRDVFAGTVELYSNFIKQMKAENPQLNVSEVSFARGTKGGGELVWKARLLWDLKCLQHCC